MYLIEGTALAHVPTSVYVTVRAHVPGTEKSISSCLVQRAVSADVPVPQNSSGPYARFIRQYYFMYRTGAILSHERGTKDCLPSCTWYSGHTMPTHGPFTEGRMYLLQKAVQYKFMCF